MTSALYKNTETQKRVLRYVDNAVHRGITVAELRDLMPDHHHGTISGVLSVLHGEYRIARLADTREGCKIYVHPDYLDGRAAEAQGRGGPSASEIARLQAQDEFLNYWLQVDSEGARFVTDKTKAERNQRLFFSQLKSMHRADQ